MTIAVHDVTGTNAAVAESAPGSLHHFFAPRSVAVVGVSRNRHGVGWAIFRNLASRFSGRVVPINPGAGQIDSVQAYSSLGDVPGAIDLAVIAVPAMAVDAVIDDCIRKAVPAVIVISAGFGETGDAGRIREVALREKVRQAGMRMIGPNCLGVVNTDPSVNLNASFSPAFPPAGPIAFSSQSGALGLAVLECARRLNLGLSAFVSVGNKADVSTNDLIEHWATDPRTRVILLYVESFGNPRRFGQIARRVGRIKPIVAVKAGRSRSGARAASSHTGALAASDTVVNALFRDAGVIRTDTLEQLFDVAKLLAHQPLPAGARVAVLTNAGGPGILAADACESSGLALPPLTPATVEALRDFLPITASVGNPVDMIATAPAEHYRRAIPLLLADPNIDSLLTIFIPPLVTKAADVATAIAETARDSTKPVLATFFAAEGVLDVVAPVPCYDFPESAVAALAHAVSYSKWRSLPAEPPPVLADFNLDAARRIVSDAVSGDGWLSPLATFALLGACGILTAPIRVVGNGDEAAAVAQNLGYPVVLKGSGPHILHKTEAHLVCTELQDEAAVRHAFETLVGHPEVTQVLIQPMVSDGVEMFVGAQCDEKFGHVVMCGSGGTLVEVLHDVSCRLSPLSEMTARQMLDDIRGIVRLRGFRGAPVRNEAGLRDVVLRVSALVGACPEITELDLNPVIVTSSSACVVDARIRIGHVQISMPSSGSPEEHAPN
jgi:acetyl coenzyme A synthetase (ADP forming)-like protein